MKLLKVILFNKAFTHLKFRAQQLNANEVTEKIHPITGQKTTWGVLTDSLVVIFSGCKKCDISSKRLVRSIRLGCPLERFLAMNSGKARESACFFAGL